MTPEQFQEEVSKTKAKIVLDSELSLIGQKTKIYGDITIDLNGNKLHMENKTADSINVYSGGKLTLMDSKGTGKIYCTKTYPEGYKVNLITLNGDAKFVMNSGLIDTGLDNPGVNGHYAIGVYDAGKVIINGGKINAGWFAISGNGSETTKDAEIVINGGTIISLSNFAIYHPHPGKITINGGVISGAGGAVAFNAGEFVFNNGTFTSTGSEDIQFGDYSKDGTYGLADAAININCKYGDVGGNINGGTIVSKKPVLINEDKYTPSLVIKGGMFIGEDVSYLQEYCAEGVSINSDGSISTDDSVNLVNSSSIDTVELNKMLGSIGSCLEGLTKQYVETELIQKYEQGDINSYFTLQKILRFSDDKEIREYIVTRMQSINI